MVKEEVRQREMEDFWGPEAVSQQALRHGNSMATL
jgi:hypothetical protein